MPTEMAARLVPTMGPSVMQSILAKAHSILGRPMKAFATCSARSAERRALRELAQDPHLLNDIGLSRDQALREASKLFWRS